MSDNNNNELDQISDGSNESDQISDNEVLSIKQLCNRVGITRNQVYNYERDGLVIRQRGGRFKVIGKDWNDFWRTAPSRLSQSQPATVESGSEIASSSA